MTLTPAQQAALTAFRIFLRQPHEPVFLLRGYAGTGKTFLLKALLAELPRPAVLLAPTGRAAGVLRQQTQRAASTIHRGIYDYSALKPLQTGRTDADKSFRFFFDVANNTAWPVGTVFVVDEASMVGDAFSESEFFRLGSGQLLTDLLRYVQPSAQNGYKLLLVGDRAQLPPVGDPDSPALNAAELSRRLGGVPVREVELTDVMRQQAGSGILANATTVRECLRTGQFAGLRLQRSSDVQDVPLGRLLPAYLQAGGGPQAGNQAIIITYSNTLARQYNEQIRTHFFPGQPQVQVGDRLIITQNNYGNPLEPLHNGDFAQVLHTGSVETRQVRVRINKATMLVPLAWRPVRLRLTHADGTTYEVDRLLLESFLNSPDNALRPEEIKALYVDAVMRCRRQHGYDDRHRDFPAFLRQDAHFHAVRAKYGYAITCHKAQGGTWHTAFVDFQGFSGRQHAHYFRWVYTALTRASHQLYLLNAADFTPWQQMRIFDPAAQAPRPSVPLFPEVVAAQTAQFDSLDALEARLGIATRPMPQQQQFRRVAHQLQELGAEIEAVESVPNAERYTMRKGQERGQVLVYYKKDQPLSSVQPTGPASPITQAAVAQLRAPLPETVSIQQVDFPAEAPPALAGFYEQFVEQAQQHSISILAVQHKPYAERYQLQDESGRAVLLLDYDKKGRITGVRVEQHNSQALLEKIHALLQLLD